MTAYKFFSLTCDQCGKVYEETPGHTGIGETAQCVMDMATDNGWLCEVEVPNGSLWDFCSEKCKEA